MLELSLWRRTTLLVDLKQRPFPASVEVRYLARPHERAREGTHRAPLASLHCGKTGSMVTVWLSSQPISEDSRHGTHPSF